MHEKFWKAVEGLGLDPKALNGLELEASSKGFRLYSPRIKEMPSTPNDSYGLLAIRASGKPTSFFLRAFHRQIKKKIEVSLEELGRLLEGKEVPVKARPGWCLVSFEGVPIGCGLVKAGKLRLEIPKDDRERMKAGLRNLKLV